MKIVFAFYYLVLQAGVLAQASAPEDFSGWFTIVNVGLAGVGLFAFMRGWIVPGVIHDQAIEREKQKQAEVESLRAYLDDQILPELRRSIEVQQKMTSLTERFLTVVEHMTFKPKDDP